MGAGAGAQRQQCIDRLVPGRSAPTRSEGVPKRTAFQQLVVTLLPAFFIVALLAIMYRVGTAPEVEVNTAGLIQAGGLVAAPEQEREGTTGLIGAEPDAKEAGVTEPPAEPAKEGSPAETSPAKGPTESSGAAKAVEKKSAEALAETQARLPVPLWVWIAFGVGIAFLVFSIGS